MIVKKIKHANDPKPKEWQISGLVNYISGLNENKRGEKIEYAKGINFLCDELVAQKVEMIALARETVHSKMPVNHWIFSWPEGEQPTHEQVDELVKMFLEGMGLEGHQAIYGLHCDTKNYHVHIAVNRVHPETFKVIRTNNGFDIRQAHKVRVLIEQKQGWSTLENSPYVITEEGEIAKRQAPEEIKPTPKARDFEVATGEKSAQRFAQERGHEIIKNAKSWQELHGGLKKVGLRFEKKGSGAIVWVGETAIKASSIDRAFSMGKLVKRMGEFEAGDYDEEIKATEPEPLNNDYPQERQIYEQACKEVDKKKAEILEQEQEEIEALRQKHKEQWQKGLPTCAEHGLLNIGRHFLKRQQRKERAALYIKLRQKRPSFTKPRYRDWLLRRGKVFNATPQASKLTEEKARHTPAPMPTTPQAKAFLEYAKAVNAERYRVTAIKIGEDGSRKVLILDKKDGQSKGFTPEELLAKMPEILALRQRGENIYYTPISDEKHHILIDDVSPENVVKLQQDGYRPAAIIESSPGNFQCILTFAKFKGQFDREIGNRLALMLNKKYGDPKLSGAIHPHRAPAFENRKPKHRRKDGTFPQSTLRYSVRQECQKCLVEARKIEQELANQAKLREKSQHTFTAPANAIGPQAAYYAHYANIKAHITIEDFSRVDAMIALRMRANGHSEDEVYDAIVTCAPTIRDEKSRNRNWERYAERTADYAFGFAGDRDIMRYSQYKQLWAKVEEKQTMNRRLR